MRRQFLIPILGMLAAACGGASPESGVTANFRVLNGQFVSGPIDETPGADLPEIHTLDSKNNVIYRGVTGKSAGGTAGPGSFAVHAGLRDDAGYWIVPIEDPDINTPEDLTFTLRMAFSPTLPAGKHAIVLRAIGRDGTPGKIFEQNYTLLEAEPAPAMRITLAWDTQADLDIRMLVPNTKGGAPIEIGSSKKTSLAVTPVDPPPTQEEIDAAGLLDFDSNGQCVIDGQRRETVTWTQAPAAGHYEIRVDAFSMCGEGTARWKLTVEGAVNDAKYGQMSDIDTRFDHGARAGLLVTTFDL